jgi:hypothetical protein
MAATSFWLSNGTSYPSSGVEHHRAAWVPFNDVGG